VVVCIALLSSCRSEGHPPTERLSPRSHTILDGQHSFFDLAWLPDGWLVLNRSGLSVFDNAETLWRARPDGLGLVELSLATGSPTCRRFRYLGPTTLPSGRVGFLRWCDVRGSDRTILALMTYDMTRAKARPLMSRPLGYNPDQFTWNPSMTQGLFGLTSGICAGMGAMTRREATDLALSLPVAGRPHPVQEDLQLPGDADCSAAIRADMPTWSPDGQRIAFLASPDSIGRGGLARAETAWSLYLVGPDWQYPIAVRAGLVDPHGTDWSPDGRWVAYSGKVAGRGDGVWLYRVADGELVKVASGTYGGMAWSPDGSAMAVVRGMKTTGDQLVNTEVRILDLSNVLSDTNG
jgi:WD40-like Beta Propeller Repeat